MGEAGDVHFCLSGWTLVYPQWKIVWGENFLVRKTEKQSSVQYIILTMPYENAVKIESIIHCQSFSLNSCLKEYDNFSYNVVKKKKKKILSQCQLHRAEFINTLLPYP